MRCRSAAFRRAVPAPAADWYGSGLDDGADCFGENDEGSEESLTVDVAMRTGVLGCDRARDTTTRDSSDTTLPESSA